jgi:hypothetical protein
LQVKVAIHRLLREDGDALLFAFELGKFVNTFDGGQGAVAVEEDQVVARPSGGIGHEWIRPQQNRGHEAAF